jgi:hypothetical protein
VTSDAKKKADSALASAKGQAKKALDEATARATAIHDGAERRLNLLSTRHSETIKRLTDILDGVSGLVAAETARLSLEDEVDEATAKAIAAADSAGGARPAQNQPGPNGPGPNGPAGPNGSTGPRLGTSQPGASQPGAGTAPRSSSSTAPQPVLSSSVAPPASAQSAQAQDKRPAARAAVLDSDETSENIRIVPGGDN